MVSLRTIHFYLLLLSVALIGCQKLSRVISFNKTDAEFYTVPTEDAGNGSTSGYIRSDAVSKQRLFARAGNGIDGTMILVSPGSIKTSAKFLIEKHSDFATTDLAKALGVSAAISQVGPAIKFSSDPKLEALTPMTITIPGPPQSSQLSAFLSSNDDWVLFYEMPQLTDGESYKTAIIPRSEFEIEGGKVLFKTKLLGRFQAAIATPSISTSFEKPDSVRELLEALAKATTSSTTTSSTAVVPVEPVLASVASGTYGPAQTVVLTTATADATIYYTTDGSSPSSLSQVFSGSIYVNSSTMIKAMATKAGYSDSVVLELNYVITTPSVDTPIVDIAAGEYGPSQSVTLSTSTSGTEIYFTTDGTTPSTSSTRFTSAITVNSSRTVKAIGVKTGLNNSQILTAAYTINGQAAAPVASVVGGKFISPQSIALSSATSGTAIYYTTDGNTPNTSTSALYSSPIAISHTTTIKAIAVKTHFITSSVMTETYTKNIVLPLAVDAFPDTTQYYSAGVTWIPKVKFSIENEDTLGLFSSTSGTQIMSNTTVSSAENILAANSVNTLGQTQAINMKNAKPGFVNMGSYTTKLPPNFSVRGVDGQINAIVKDNISTGCTTTPGCMYIGGFFKIAGHVSASNIAKLKPDGSFEALGTGVDGYVYTLALDSSGHLYVGGYFNISGGVVVKNIAKWNGSSWTAVGGGLNGPVFSIAINNSGDVIAGGGFICAGQSTQSWNSSNYTCSGEVTTVYNYIARLSGNNWVAVGDGFNAPVRKIAFNSSGDTLIAGGDFICAGGKLSSGSYPSTSCTGGGTVFNYIAKTDSSVWTSNVWTALGSGTDATVSTIVISDIGNVYAGGSFSKAGGYNAAYIAKWIKSNSNWVALGAGMNAPVSSMMLDSSGILYVGGEFECAGGSINSGNYPNNNCSGTGGTTVYNHIAKWNGASWSAVGTGTNSEVISLAFDGAGKLIVGGGFNFAGSASTQGLAFWDGSSWTYPSASGLNYIFAIVFDSSGVLYVGGNFTAVDGNLVNYIAKWNGETWSPVGSGFNGPVFSLKFDSSGNLFAGGDFTCAGGSTSSGTYPNNVCSGSGGGPVYNGVAKWNGSSWANLGSGVSGYVHVLTIDSNSEVFVGGKFVSAGGNASASNIAKWNGTSWSSLGFGGSTHEYIRTLAIGSAGKLYVGGQFTKNLGATNAVNIAQWDGENWSALGSGLNSLVFSLAIDNAGKLYAGGNFSASGATTIRGVAIWDGATWAALNTSLQAGAAYALAIDSANNLYVGGYFSTAGGVAVKNIAKVSFSSGGEASWSPLGLGVDNSVNTIAVNSDGQVVAGGYFGAAGGKVRPYIAKWLPIFSEWF